MRARNTITKLFTNLFAVFVIALLLVSVASAAPFQFITSTKFVKAEQTDKIYSEPVKEAEDDALVTTANKDEKPALFYHKIASNRPFIIMRESQDIQELDEDAEDEMAEDEPEITIADQIIHQDYIYFPQDDAGDLQEDQEDQEGQEDPEDLPEYDDGEGTAEDSPDSGDEPIYWNNGIGVHHDALTIHDAWWWGEDSGSTELHIDSKSVSGDTTAGNTFTLTITATDSDDHVTTIAVAGEPYAPVDYTTLDCEAESHSCTLEFDMSEADTGVYTYWIDAENDAGDLAQDAITVTVTESASTGVFNFRTAALDGEDWDAGITDYVDSEIFVWGDGVTGLNLSATPFATFTVPSDYLLAARYSSEGYMEDTDWFFFDSMLPSCSGPLCSLSAEYNGTIYSTDCELVVYDNRYECTVSNGEGYSVMFDFRAETDPVGPNTIRRYNLLYPESAPIVDFVGLDVDFDEGDSYTFNLDSYVYDADTDLFDLTWIAVGEVNVDVSIDPASHDVTLSQADPSWIGTEIIEFIAFDPEGNRGSDLLTVEVLNTDNNPPVIISKDPDSDFANVGLGSSRLFTIDAMDPDYDPLEITWRKGGDVVASGTFTYLYEDTDGVARPLTVSVSDGTDEVGEAWTIDIVAPIGSISGTVTDSDGDAPLSDVTVELLDAGLFLVDETTTDGLGNYIFNNVDEGTYDISFTLADYDDEIALGVEVFAGETTRQDMEMTRTPDPIGTLSGTVTDFASGAVLSGVTVEAIQGGSVVDTDTTDGSGDYSIELLAGTYDVRFTLIGYDAEEVIGVMISTGVTTDVDVSLSETTSPIGEITGTVRDDATGLPISGALVKLLDGPTIVNSTLTSGSGVYSMEVLEDTLDVEVTKAGYRTAFNPAIFIPAGSVITQDFDLGTWWDTDWGYRRAVDLDSGFALTDYAILLNVTHETGMNSDFSDLRFVSEEGAVELDYWIEDKLDDNWCSVWVEFDDVTAGVGQQAWMYYGNALVTTTSDGAGTFLLWDDFEDGSLDPALWLDVSSGGASVTESGGHISLNNDGSHRGYLRTAVEMPMDIEIRMQADVNNDNGQFYTFMQWDGTHAGSYDRVTGTFIQASDSYTGSQRLIAYSADVPTTIGSADIARPFTMNSYVFNRYSGDYEFWLNGVMIISVYNGTVGASNYVGFGGRETLVDTDIENVLIRDFVLPEPSYTIGTEELL